MTAFSAPTTETPATELPEYPMPRAAGCPFDPPPALQKLQDRTRIARVRIWNGDTPWLITRYEDQRTLLADPRISSDTTKPGFPYESPGVAQTTVQPAPDGLPGTGEPGVEPVAFLGMDDPEHSRQRRMVTTAFTVRRTKAMRPGVQQIVDDLIDALLDGPNPADLVETFALPVPSLVICNLLGVPYEDRDFFQARSDLLPRRSTTAEQAAQAMAELSEYLGHLIEQKRTDPADDVLSTLAQQITEGGLTRRQAAHMAVMLLFGGHETTANMISLGALALFQHPDQLARVRDNSDNPQLIASAVEELLRYLSIPQLGRRRVALADIEIGGVTIRAGESVIIAHDVGNRDPSVFDDPDRLDIERDARRQIAFGFGVHQCLGQPLARLELEVVFGTLYRRIPTLRLAAPVDQLSFKNDGIAYGMHELPVTW
ncbi:cytochrome P450 [Streptomyces sp. NPDC020965]|uniref:cytochrome P450 n=1 Tax=Streptomyces sp. NPDC020965 TaxID=3365105 RepID=UPI0037935F01